MNPEMAGMPDHYPQRGDQVEAWLEDRLKNSAHSITQGPWFQGQKRLLEEYRYAADSGLSLEEVVNGVHKRPPRGAPKKRKKER